MSKATGPARDEALALHRQGRLPEARAAYEALLSAAPEDADVTGLLALVMEARGDAGSAEALLRRSLDFSSVPAIALRNANNLFILLLEGGREAEARLTAGSIVLPAWPAGERPDEREQDILISLFQALTQLDQAPKAIDIIREALPYLEHENEFLLDVARICLKAGRPELANALVGPMDPARTPDGSILTLQSASALAMADHTTAYEKRQALAAQIPVFWSAESKSQRATIAVLNEVTGPIRDYVSPFEFHYLGNYPTQLADSLSDRFRFVSVLASAPTDGASPLGTIRPGVVINNCVNAEKLSTPGTLSMVSDVAARLNAPVINAPEAAIRMTRQLNAQRFAMLPGITAPRVLRFRLSPELIEPTLREIVSTLGPKVIIRTVFQQMGAGTTLCEGMDAIRSCLASLDVEEFYAIEYVASPHAGGLFRQMRLAFVNGVSRLMRVDYSDHWNARARRNPRAHDFYQRRPDMLRLADAILDDPASGLDSAALDRAREIATLVPLQIFGMDFDINEQGQVVIYEVNATMNLFSSAPPHLPYPPEPDRDLLGLMEAFLVELASTESAAGASLN